MYWLKSSSYYVWSFENRITNLSQSSRAWDWTAEQPICSPQQRMKWNSVPLISTGLLNRDQIPLLGPMKKKLIVSSCLRIDCQFLSGKHKTQPTKLDIVRQFAKKFPFQVTILFFWLAWTWSHKSERMGKMIMAMEIDAKGPFPTRAEFEISFHLVVFQELRSLELISRGC